MSKRRLMATSNAAAARNAAKLQRAESRQHMSSISTEIPSVPSAVSLDWRPEWTTQPRVLSLDDNGQVAELLR